MTRFFWISLALAVATPASLGAGDGSPPADDRIARLESGLADLRREVQALREMVEQKLAEAQAGKPAAQGLASIADTIESVASGLEAEQQELAEAVRSNTATVEALSAAEQRRTQVSVYGTFNIIDPQGQDSVFDAEAFELVFSGQRHDRLGFFAEIEFERAAAVGSRRGGEVLLEQAYATYTFSPAVNLRAGVILVPFGNFNVDHYAPNRDVISKPLVSYVVAPSDWTDNGLGLHGSLITGTNWSFEYETYLVAGLDANITALGTRAARQGFGIDNNDDKSLVGRFAFSRAGALNLGLSGYTGKYDDDDRLRLTGWAVDGSFELRRLRLTGEYNRFGAEQPTGPDAILEGYYGRLVLDVTSPWLRGGWHGRAFPTASLALVAQVDHVCLDGPLDGLMVTNSERRTTFGLNYRPNHHWVLKLDYEDSEATGAPLQKGDFRGYLASVGFQF
ncbi:MAG: hypothetical protein GY719_16790 [bacterium]|nr:hypothetical protein [bacterium]